MAIYDAMDQDRTNKDDNEIDGAKGAQSKRKT